MIKDGYGTLMERTSNPGNELLPLYPTSRTYETIFIAPGVL